MLKLANIFSDHMVLQRNKSVSVWGDCSEKEVVIAICEKKVTAIVQDGMFEAKIPPMQAGGPYTMTVTDGKDTIAYQDVMIGEVWFAGGQSNMELELQNSFEPSAELEKIHNEAVRYYYVPKEPWVNEAYLEKEKETAWECPSKETSGRWSAVAYYYAKEISRKLGVTVGIIGCNWGGTSASCWQSREALLAQEATRSYVDEYDEIIENQNFEEYVKEREEYIVYQTAFEEKVSHYYETNENPTWDEAIRLFGENKYPGPMGPYSEFRPAGLYETMVKRVIPYTLAGFIYYQGEEDDHKPETYFELLCSLVNQWRTDWMDESLPFFLVQLPVFQNMGEPDYKNWPLIREAQMRLFQTHKNTGIAVILENGEYGNIHPTKKEVVGKRLALQALYEVYGLCGKEEAFGPIFKSAYTDGKEMVIEFSNCPDGFVCKNDVTGFEVAGSDREYKTASFEIRGNQIVVQSEEVDSPKYARYCWTNYQEIGLFGKNGIPVAPFRTSRQDGSSVTGSRLTNEGVM